MKKIIILLSLFILIIAGCKSKEIDTDKIKTYYSELKLSLYKYEGFYFYKQENYLTDIASNEVIGLFSVIYSDEIKIHGYGVRGTWNEYYNKYKNIDDYKIGYEISFKLLDGTEYLETILKPLEFTKFSFSQYLYIWLYDDINSESNFYNHLQENDYNDKTIMTSIKLMATSNSFKIDNYINLTVFAYKDENDFDEFGRYIGSDKFTTIIKKG